MFNSSLFLLVLGFCFLPAAGDLISIAIPATILIGYRGYWLVEQPMIEKGSKLAAAASSRLAARDELR